MELKITEDMNGKIIKLNKNVLVYKAVIGAIVQLLLTKGTEISVPSEYAGGDYVTWYKLRASKATVIAIIPAKKYRGKAKYQDLKDVDTSFQSKRDSRFMYKMGEVVVPQEFHRASTYSCKGGIHFFTSIEYAEKWL